MSPTVSLLLVSLGLAASWTALHRVPTRGVNRCTVPRAMFSGIVEEMGTIRSLRKVDGLSLWDGSVGQGWKMEVEASEVLGQASLGCSIAVNGVCLTVTEFDSTSFSAGLAPETIRRSNLIQLKKGDPVNLERALPADGRNSGHFVQGHVDDVGIIEELRPDGDSLFVKVRPPARLLPYIVPKGFIAVDGTSLTVCEVNYAEGWFNFMLVEYTQQEIIIPTKSVGAAVNLEVQRRLGWGETGGEGLGGAGAGRGGAGLSGVGVG